MIPTGIDAMAANEQLEVEEERFVDGAWDDRKLSQLLNGELLHVHVDAIGLDARGERKVTALMFAAFMGHVDAVDMLVARGADLEAGRLHPDGWTALHIACSRGHWAVLTRLLAAGADLNYTNRNRPARTALGRSISRHTTVWDVAISLGGAVAAGRCAEAAIATLCEVHRDSPGSAL